MVFASKTASEIMAANSVASYLRALGVNSARIIDVQGKAYNEPVASNDTAEGRAQNRRVELFVTANQNMIQAANAKQGESAKLKTADGKLAMVDIQTGNDGKPVYKLVVAGQTVQTFNNETELRKALSDGEYTLA